MEVTPFVKNILECVSWNIHEDLARNLAPKGCRQGGVHVAHRLR